MGKERTVHALEPSRCTGCGACYNRCPVDAITMEADGEGFPRPVIDWEKCVDCGACYQSCPALTPVEFGDPNPECYAVWAKDEVRWVSSSGGMFTLAADYVLEQGGHVCGAAFSEDFRSVSHTVVGSWEELPPLRKSKYVQSDIGDVFRQLKSLLEQGSAPVLFCGCPCQVAGLYGYLGKEYKNLYTLDLVCHGVPSPKAYRVYLDELAKGRKIEQVDFRPKEHGWGTPLKVLFEDGSNHFETSSDKWYTAFLKAYSTRDCCTECPYAQPRRVGNITIADFWGIGKHNPEWNDQKGTSLILLNDKKGRALFERVKGRIIRKEKMPLEIALPHNGNLRVPMRRNPMRGSFFKHLDSHGFTQALRYAWKHRFDVGVVGWWYGTNYGSSLTSFALYQLLRSMDLSVLMISPPEERWKSKEPDVVAFTKKYYRVSAPRDVAHLQELNNYCDSFIVGSDQLWNYHAGYTPFHFLNFAEDGKRKIAYATSFGHSYSNFPEEKLPEVRYYMQRFDAISLRETDGVQLAKKTFGVKATHVLDPVFLCPTGDYDTLASDSPRKIEGDYVFCYLLDPDEGKRKALEYIGKSLGINFVTVVDRQHNHDKKAEFMKEFGVMENATLSEWLYHLKNAKFVFTDSFHGMCYSVLFEKSFICVTNAHRGISRFTSLLPELGLMDRMVHNGEQVLQEPRLLEKVDFTQANAYLKEERVRSLRWLTESLEAVKPEVLTENDMAKREIYSLRKALSELRVKYNSLQEAVSQLVHPNKNEQ